MLLGEEVEDVGERAVPAAAGDRGVDVPREQLADGLLRVLGHST